MASGIDIFTKSPIFEIGPTTGEFTHTPGAAPRAVVVVVAGWEKNATDVTAVTYGGSAMTQAETAIGPETTFPFTSIWYLDNIAVGAKTVVVTKNANAKVQCVCLTLNATGAVILQAAKGGGGTSQNPTIPAMEAGGTERLALGISLSKNIVVPSTRSDKFIEQEDVGALAWDIQWANMAAGGTKTFSWGWAESAANSRVGVMLVVPGLTVPATPPFNGDFQTGNKTQYASEQANPNRVSVVTTTKPLGTYSCKFEHQVGDANVANGRRAELLSGLEFASGEEKYFRIIWNVELVDQSAPGRWQILWQLHDNGGGSPPVCLLMESNELKLVNGTGTPLFWKRALPTLSTWNEAIVRVLFHATTGKIAIKYNGSQQIMEGGGTLLENQNTIGVAPDYDKIGIYRATAAEGTTIIYHAYYRIETTEPASLYPFTGEEETPSGLKYPTFGHHSRRLKYQKF